MTREQRCRRCGVEIPIGLLTYVFSIGPGIKGLNVETNRSPVQTRKGGLCKTCAKRIAEFADTDGISFTYEEMIFLILDVQSKPEVAERWTKALDAVRRHNERRAASGTENDV